jgi:ATP-dependent Clp protease adaptor protein ClpS
MRLLRFALGFLLVVLGPGVALLGCLTVFFGLFGGPSRALAAGVVLFVLGLCSAVVGLRLRNFDFLTYRAVGLALPKRSRQALKPVLTQAFQLAQSNRSVTLWHVIWALAETEEVRQILSAFDIAPGELASICQRRCSELPTRRRWPFGKSRVDRQVKASVQRAVTHSISSEQPNVRAEHILLDLISPEAPDEIRETLVAAGLRRLPLRAFVAHRTLELASPSIPARGAVEVLMLNDEFTTREFVQNALRKIFDLPESAAERLMLEVHQSGEASLGTMDAEDAREKISRTLADAKANDFPLRFALE